MYKKRILFLYYILNCLIYFFRRRNAGIAQAEIKYILLSVDRGKLLSFFKHHSDCRVILHKRYHLF